MECDLDLEDGEIDEQAEVEAEVYVPLERPDRKPISQPIVHFPSDVEDPSEDSSSDSDDSQNGRLRGGKKLKKKRPLRTSPLLPNKKKYNIWCADVSEEVLSNTLNKCNVDRLVDNSRDVETYNHLLPFSHEVELNKALRGRNDVDPDQVKSNKRNHTGNFVKQNRKNFKYLPKQMVRATPRDISPLTATIDDSPEDLARDIANKLLEEKESIILNAINAAGKDLVLEIFEQTREIEQTGGLMIMNGTRRRTPGGVFLYLLKGSPNLTTEQTKTIFLDDKREIAANRKQTFREIRKAKVAKRKEAINNEDFPTLLSKTAAIMKSLNPEQVEDSTEEGGVKNPPPSPATDGKDNSSDGEETNPNQVDFELLPE